MSSYYHFLSVKLGIKEEYSPILHGHHNAPKSTPSISWTLNDRMGLQISFRLNVC